MNFNLNFKLSSIILLLAALFIVSCRTPEKKTDVKNVKPAVREKDLTRTHRGKAVISEIVASKDYPGNDNSGYMDIYFNFIPDNRAAPGNYLCGECPDRKIRLFYDHRDSFHTSWVMKWGIKPGREYPAVRHELLRKDNRASVTHEVILEP